MNYWSSPPWLLVFSLLCVLFSIQSSFNGFSFPSNFSWTLLIRLTDLLPNTLVLRDAKSLPRTPNPVCQHYLCDSYLYTFCILFQLVVYHPQKGRNTASPWRSSVSYHDIIAPEIHLWFLLVYFYANQWTGWWFVDLIFWQLIMYKLVV